jgi:hypothetical protein
MIVLYCALSNAMALVVVPISKAMLAKVLNMLIPLEWSNIGNSSLCHFGA